MASFTAADVKTLREMTSVGMMDCKKALTECDGDMDKAVEYLREKGLAKAAKKANNRANAVNLQGFSGKSSLFVNYVKALCK